MVNMLVQMTNANNSAGAGACRVATEFPRHVELPVPEEALANHGHSFAHPPAVDVKFRR